MSSRSQGSVSSRSRGSASTAPRSGGTPRRNYNMNSHANTPPRTAMTNSRKPAPAVATSSGRGTAQGGTHVVRVTFLGVSGLLAKPPHLGGATPAAAAEGGANQTVAGEQEPPSRRQVTTSPAAAEHPSLLFPLPHHLRLVASVSRSRTARGIPSEISKRLSRSGQKNSGGGGGYLKPVIEEVVLSVNSSPSGRVRERSSKSGGSSLVIDGTPIVEVLPLPSSSPSDKSNKAERHDTGEANIEEEQPERFVAIWDEGQTNALAFEAELRPSTLLANSPQEGGTSPTPSPSSTFAPKSFFVTLGLVLDYDASPSLDGGRSMGGSGASMPPTFAIPVAFTDLVINGAETLDGRRKKIDLPLSSISNMINAFGDDALASANYFPLIPLTAEGLVSKGDAKMAASEPEKATEVKVEKTKKKSIVKRIFSRKKHPPSVPTIGDSSSSQAPVVYSGPPRSIFELGRPPDAKERSLFLDRYGVDLNGGAVLRIGLEVFPRGSDLEKIFRQKKFLRKQAQAKKKTQIKEDRRDDISHYSHSTSGSLAQSLMDIEDSDCDDDSVYSESYFTLDDETHRSTWDESTAYTDGFSRMSSFNTAMSMDTYMTENDYVRLANPRSNSSKQPPSRSFLSNFFSCNVDTSCGKISGGEIHGLYSNDDAVASSGNGEIHGMSSNNDAVTSAVGRMSIVDEEDITESNEKQDALDDAIHSRSHVETISSEASVDTEKHRTTDQRRAVTLDIDVPLVNRSVTVANETTPLAVILQRVLQEPDEDEKVKQDQAGEVHVLTAEDNLSVTATNETTPLAALIVQRVSQEPNEDEKVKRDAEGEGYEFTAEDHYSGSL